MNFVADESVDGDIVQRLRQKDHHVWYVAEMEPGLSDDQVLQLAHRETALLLTADKDFGEIVFRQRRFSGGIVLVRLAGLSAQRKQDIVATTVTQHASQLPQSFTVITPGLCRIRPLPGRNE
jgi:predicted nuclease of predicted toxin-antitoxin system